MNRVVGGAASMPSNERWKSSSSCQSICRYVVSLPNKRTEGPFGGHSGVLGSFGVFLRFLGVNSLWVNVGFMSLKGEMEKLIIMSIHLPLCCFVANERKEGPLEGHRGFAVLPFLHLEFVRNLRVDQLNVY